MNIRIQADLESVQILDLINVWDECDNVSLEIAPMSEYDIRALFATLISFLPCEFCEAVLETLVERGEIPVDLLEVLSNMPTKSNSCMMSICLRDGLSDVLANKCASCEDEEVREHYLQRQAWLRRNQ